MSSFTLEPARVLESEQDREVWRNEVVDRLLSKLVEQTQSDVVLFRTLDCSTGKLVLGCYAASAKVQQRIQKDGQRSSGISGLLARVISRRSFDIPREKKLLCWGEHDPLSSWGMISYSAGAVRNDNLDEYTESEREFVRWVKQKAWFPIMLGGGAAGVIILVRGSRKEFELREVTEAWLFAQDGISHSLKAKSHQGFTAAVGALRLAQRASTRTALLQTIAHCLASHFGLEWNRVWLLEEACDRENFFRCRAALGELTAERWRMGVQSCGQQFTSLKEEVEDVLTRGDDNEDALFRGCVTQKPSLTIALSERAFQFPFPSVPDGKAERCFSLAEPLRPQMMTVADSLEGELARRSRKMSCDYEPNSELLGLSLVVGEYPWLLLLSRQFFAGQSAVPSLILTAAFVHAAAQMVYEWERKASASGEEEAEDEELSPDQTKELQKNLDERLQNLKSAPAKLE